jgi:hypothetical protein
MVVPSSATIKKDSKYKLSESRGRKRSFSEFCTWGNPTSSCSSIGDSTEYSAVPKRAKISSASEIKTNTLLSHSSPGFSKQLSSSVRSRAYSSFQEIKKDCIPKNNHNIHSSNGIQRLSWSGSLALIDGATNNSKDHEIKNYSTIYTYDDGPIDSSRHRKVLHETSPIAVQLKEEQEKRQHTLLSPSLSKKMFDNKREAKPIIDLNNNPKNFLQSKVHHNGKLFRHCRTVAQKLLFIFTMVCSIYFFYQWHIQKQMLIDQFNAFQLQQSNYEHHISDVVAKLEEESKRAKESEIEQTQQIEALVARLEDRSKSSMESELHYKQLISNQKQQIDALIAKLEDQSKSYMETELHHKQLVTTLLTELDDQSRNSAETLNAVVFAQAERKLVEEQQLKQDYEALLDLCQENALHAIQAVVDEMILQEHSQQPASVWLEPIPKLENASFKDSSNIYVKKILATDVEALMLHPKEDEDAHSLLGQDTPISLDVSNSTSLDESANYKENNPFTEEYNASHLLVGDESIVEELNTETGTVVNEYPDEDQTEEEEVFENEEDIDGYIEGFDDEEWFGDERFAFESA